MSKRTQFTIAVILSGGLLAMVVAGCRPDRPAAATLTPPLPGSTPTQSVTTPSLEVSPTPAPTSPPLAARAARYPISLAEYEAELAMAQAARGTELAPQDAETVLQDLIDQALLAEAAVKQGFTADDALIEDTIARMVEQLGSEQALQDWYIGFKYDDQTFRLALRRSIQAAWMRDRIAAQVPTTAEQVHVRQILLYEADQANEVYRLLESGNSFRNLALQYDPVTGGDLGWFPRGYLPHPQIEEAAFNLDLEAYSPIIETPAGFHILQLLERDSARALAPDALLALQAKAVADWLAQNRQTAEIEVLLP
ncbi:MAG: peptidylprolyl isomerase [Anaerolineales bacterium]|nr:peptidylprolyl isomerase [Anaerolineales bacterium]